MLTNLMMVIILHLYRNSCLDFFLITKINFNRVKRIDSDLQDEKWDGNSGIPFSCEVCLSHVPIVRIITCVNPGEGTVLLIAHSSSSNTQRVLLFETFELFPSDKLGQTLAIFREEVGRIWVMVV